MKLDYHFPIEFIRDAIYASRTHEVRSAKTSKGFAYYFDKVGNPYIWCVKGATKGMLVLQNPYNKASPRFNATHHGRQWYLRLQHVAFKIQGKVIHDNLFVHRGVAMAFPEICGEPDLFRNQIDHINGDKHDNRACNLRWVSQSENIKAAVAAKRLAAHSDNCAERDNGLSTMTAQSAMTAYGDNVQHPSCNKYRETNIAKQPSRSQLIN